VTRLRERVARYRGELAGKRVLIVLDDAITARQVRPFLPGNGGSAVPVTSRARLTTVSTQAHIELGVMSAEESTGLLTQVIGAKGGKAATKDNTLRTPITARNQLVRVLVDLAQRRRSQQPKSPSGPGRDSTYCCVLRDCLTSN
jgi:hypothetical protein